MKWFLLSLFIALSVSSYSQCLEITNVFVDACGVVEGENEMFSFEVGATALNSSNLTVDWPNNTFQGFCQNITTANKKDSLNATITNSCGFLLEPTAGLLPAGANVVVISSTDFDVNANSFVGLVDTMYLIFQCSGNTAGHFANTGSGIRTLVVTVSGTCVGADTVSYDRALLQGTDGATVSYDNAGNPSYINNGCNAPVVSINPSWNIADVCQTSSPINLNTLLSPGATTGGAWSGSAGVTDSIFDPSGILGVVSITYSLAATGSCSSGLDSTINFNVVLPAANEIVNLQSCDSLFYAGTWYYSDTSINDSISGLHSYSCDSTYTTVISISSEIRDSSYFENCMSYMYDGVLYTSDTILYDTLQASGGSGGGATCPELYFSEYAEGSSNNKYFEIYNGTGAAVNLANYSVERYNNGATAATDVQILSGMLADGDVYVIYNSGANATIQAAGDLISTITFYNGDDAIALLHSGVMIDLIGNIGCDPGTEWGSGTLVTKEATLVRNSNYTSGVTTDPTNVPCDFPSLIPANWTGLAQDDFSNIGMHTSNCTGSIASACDTINIVEINIIESVSSTKDTMACDSIQFLGNWIYASTSVNDTLLGASSAGCDSIITYNFQINLSTSTSANVTSCNPANVGSVVHNLMTLNNCDSTHTVTTTLIPGDSTFSTITSCNPIDTGYATTTYSAVNTCDSLHTVYTSLISCGYCYRNDSLNLCNGDSAFLQEAWQTISGTYYDTILSIGGTLSTDTIYTETFDGVHNWTLNTSTGTNGADPNFWVINSNEAGVLPPNCGTSGGANNSLHITSTFNPAGGAAYDAGGLCGLLFCPETNTASSSSDISTLGYSNIVLSFDFIANGDALIDNASVLYSPNGGVAWNVVAASLKSPVCGSGQGQWTAASYTLPVNAENISNLRIRFNWTNNDDGMGTDPSVAINNVRIAGDTSTAGTACDTIIQTELNIAPSVIANNVNINACDSVVYNGNSYYTSISFLADSVFNAGACLISYDSIMIMIGNSSQTNQNTSICSSDSIFLENAWQNTSGIYYDTLQTSSSPNCDSVIITNLTVGASINANITTVCTNDMTQVGSTTDTLYYSSGCDSIYNTTNTVLMLAQRDTNFVCTNDVAMVNSITDTILSIGGCDSLYNVTQTYLLTASSEAITSCTNDMSMAGTQIDTILSTGNCDSIYQTNTVEYISPTYVSGNDACTNNAALASVDTVLTTQSVGGCDSILTITETVYQMVQTVPSANDTICEDGFAFIFGNNENTAGIYSDTIENNLGCDSIIETIELIVISNPVVNAGNDESINSGEEIVLSASGANTYIWSTADNTESITVSPLETTIYFVTGTNLNDCTGEDTIIVNVVLLDEQILIPTAFSPNGDGVNDTFRIVNESLFEGIIIRVYNRWGEQIFESTKNISGWDGIYKNVKQPLDSYVYYINAVNIASQKEVLVSGTITLVR